MAVAFGWASEVIPLLRVVKVEALAVIVPLTDS
jgi:hypothetical protein